MNWSISVSDKQTFVSDKKTWVTDKQTSAARQFKIGFSSHLCPPSWRDKRSLTVRKNFLNPKRENKIEQITIYWQFFSIWPNFDLTLGCPRAAPGVLHRAPWRSWGDHEVMFSITWIYAATFIHEHLWTQLESIRDHNPRTQNVFLTI